MSIQKVYTPLFNLEKDKQMLVQKGALQTTVSNYSRPIGTSGGRVVFSSIDPASARHLLSRQFVLTTFVLAEYEAKVNNTVFSMSDIGFRNYPLNSVINDAKLVLNGYNVNENIAENLHQQTRYNSDVDNREKNYSGRMPDLVTNYLEYAKSGKLPFDQMNDYDNKRTVEVIQVKTIVAAAAQVKQKIEVIYKIVEPLYMSLLRYKNFEDIETNPFFGITTLSLDINFSTDLSKMLASSAPVVGKCSFCTETGALSNQQIILKLTTYTPDEVVDRVLLPAFDQPIYYNFYENVIQQRQPVSLRGARYELAQAENIYFANSKQTVNMNNIVINNIPDCIYIFAQKTVKDINDADSYARLSNLKVKFANDTSNFNTFSDDDLYTMCVKNGYIHGYNQFVPSLITSPQLLSGNSATVNVLHGSGTVLKLDLTKGDINLSANLASGTLINTNLQISVDVQGTHKDTGANVEYTIFVMTQIKQLMEIKSGACGVTSNLLSPDDVINAPMTDSSKFQLMYEQENKKMSGSSVHSKKGGLRLGGQVMTASDLADLANRTVF